MPRSKSWFDCPTMYVHLKVRDLVDSGELFYSSSNILIRFSQNIEEISQNFMCLYLFERCPVPNCSNLKLDHKQCNIKIYCRVANLLLFWSWYMHDFLISFLQKCLTSVFDLYLPFPSLNNSLFLTSTVSWYRSWLTRAVVPWKRSGVEAWGSSYRQLLAPLLPGSRAG